jgi:hypothetical protein
VALDYTASGIEPFLLWMFADGFRIIVRNNSDSPIDLKEILAQGTTEGQSIVMNRDFAKPIVRKELIPRII